MTDITEARSIFDVNLYKWAKAILADEIKSQFGLVRQFRDAGAKPFLTIMDSLPPSGQQALASVLLRHRHSFAAEAVGEPVSVPEKAIVESYAGRLRDIMANEWAANRDEEISASLRGRRIRALISEHMGDRFGPLVRSDTPGIIRAERRFKDLLVVTCFSTGGGFHKLAYWHEVERSDGLRVAEFISILGWFGVCGMTGWQAVAERDIAQVLSALNSACILFHSNVASLVS